MNRILLIFLILLTNLGIKAQGDTLLSEKVVVNGFKIVGNKVTKERIILREIDIQIGDTLSQEELIQKMKTGENNLRNTSLFNFVTIDQLTLTKTHALIYISVTERWYTWPFPIFSLAETNFNTWWDNREFNRINYGIDITRYNFRGRNEKLKVLMQLGFTEKVALQYRVPYVNRNQTFGFSVGFSYSRNHEVNFISLNNDREFFKDPNDYIRQNYGAGVAVTLRKNFFGKHSWSLDFNQMNVTDTVLSFNPNYLAKGKNRNNFFTLQYFFVRDQRNNRNYALTGYYLSGAITKTGLGFFDSGVDLLDFHIGGRKFWKMGERWYPAASIQAWVGANDDQPYALQRGLGYSDKATIRSYEYYVVDGQQMGIAKAQLRYELLKPKTFEMAFIPVEKFNKFHISLYLGVFADAGYVVDNDILPGNRLANDLQYGSGISLDLVTYYDLVMRSEYSVNKFGEHGFFLHFVAPI